MFCPLLGAGTEAGQCLLKERPELAPYLQPMTAGHSAELGAKLDGVAQRLDRVIELLERLATQGAIR